MKAKGTKGNNKRKENLLGNIESATFGRWMEPITPESLTNDGIIRLLKTLLRGMKINSRIMRKIGKRKFIR